MVVWEAGARRKSTPRAGTKQIGVLLPVLPMRPPRARGDQTNVRYMLIRADGPGRQSCATYVAPFSYDQRHEWIAGAQRTRRCGTR